MRRILAIAAVAIVVAVGVIIYLRAGARSTGPRYVTVPAAYGDITATINETGTVNPVDEVQVGTQVSGTISSIAVDYNSVVKAGQTLAVIDPTSFQAANAQAQAALAAAQAQSAAAHSAIQQDAANIQAAVANQQQAEANARAAQANLAKAQAQVVLDETTVGRDQALLKQGYIAQSQVDADTTALTNDRQAVRAAQASLAAARATAASSAAQVSSAQHVRDSAQAQAAAADAQTASASAALRQSAYNLSRTVITSPIDGVVVSRNVSVGQTVAASFQTPTLFLLATTLKDMEVDTSVDEADVGSLKAGDGATITVPAFPNVTFHGTVSQVRVNPTTVQNVVTYDAVVMVHDESERLKPGMTANVTIAVAKQSHALLVPTSALLYRPGATPGATPAPVTGAAGSRTVLTVLRNHRPVTVPVTIGLSDGNNVVIASGDVKAGDPIVVAALQQQHVQAFSMFGGPRGR